MAVCTGLIIGLIRSAAIIRCQLPVNRRQTPHITLAWHLSFPMVPLTYACCALLGLGVLLVTGAVAAPALPFLLLPRLLSGRDWSGLTSSRQVMPLLFPPCPTLLPRPEARPTNSRPHSSCYSCPSHLGLSAIHHIHSSGPFSAAGTVPLHCARPPRSCMH